MLQVPYFLEDKKKCIWKHFYVCLFVLFQFSALWEYIRNEQDHMTMNKISSDLIIIFGILDVNNQASLSYIKGILSGFNIPYTITTIQSE